MDTSMKPLVAEKPDFLPPATEDSRVTPSEYHCEASSGGHVYALGTLGFDFGSQGRRDAIQAANNGVPLASNTDLSSYLLLTPSDAELVIWTLSVQATVVYAIRPSGPYAKAAYHQLQAYLLDPNIETIAVPGTIVGTVALLNGQVVPVLQPDPNGLRALSEVDMFAATSRLSGSVELAPPSAYLTGDGQVDWMNFGLARPGDVTRKRSTPLPGILIGNQLTVTFGGAPHLESGFRTECSWIDGDPTKNFIPTKGLSSGFVTLKDHHFEFTTEADRTPRVLRLFVRTTGGSSTLRATLPGVEYKNSSLWSLAKDAPPPPHVDGVYKLMFRAPSKTTLSLSWTGDGGSVVGVQALTLQLGKLNVGYPTMMHVDRLRHELRNLGVSSRERALNHAWVVAFTRPMRRLGEKTMFAAMVDQGMMLDDATSRRNEQCRVNSDCWDVVIRFFNPSNHAECARAAFRMTVYVSLVKPRVVGHVQRWNEL